MGENTAYVIATDPIHKATIIPRGRALGMVRQLPERDKLSLSRERMTSRLARMMVARWGLSEELGTVSYGENQDEVFLGM